MNSGHGEEHEVGWNFWSKQHCFNGPSGRKLLYAFSFALASASLLVSPHKYPPKF